LPTFCRVQTTALTEIKIEVWLTASGWNGNFEAIGIGGKAGIIPYANMATALKDGYATASTDTGHNKSQGELCVRRCPKCTRGKTENLTLGA
jgi:feruloyl esterase